MAQLARDLRLGVEAGAAYDISEFAARIRRVEGGVGIGAEDQILVGPVPVGPGPSEILFLAVLLEYRYGGLRERQGPT